MSYGALPLRDTIPTIVHVDGETIKAGKGLAELLERPQVMIKPCYGIKTRKGKVVLFGHENEDKAENKDRDENGVEGVAKEEEVKGDEQKNDDDAMDVEPTTAATTPTKTTTSAEEQATSDGKVATNGDNVTGKTEEVGQRPEQKTVDPSGFDKYLIGSKLEEAIRSLRSGALATDIDVDIDLRPEGPRVFTSENGDDVIQVWWPFQVSPTMNEVDRYDVGEEARRTKATKTILTDANSSEEDWVGREVLLTDIFFREFALQPSTNMHNLLLILPSSPSIPSPPDVARYSQISFERLNTPAFNVIEPPVAALFGVGLTNGLSVHVGREVTEVNVVIDSSVKYEAGVVVGVGKMHCERYLAALLLSAGATGGGSSVTGTSGTTASNDASEGSPSNSAPVEPPTNDSNNDEAKDSNNVRSQLENLLRTNSMEPTEERLSHLALALARVILCGDQEDGRPSIEVPLAVEGKAVALADSGNGEDEDGVLNVAKMLAQADANKSIQQLKEKTKKASAAATAAEKIANDRAAAAQAAAAADIKSFTLPQFRFINPNGQPAKIFVGSIRHRACEPLYDALDNAVYGSGRSIQDGMASAVDNVEVTSRQTIWEGVVFTGELARIASLPFAIVSHLAQYMLSSPDKDSEFQFSHVRVMKIPDYFAHFKGHSTELAPFLGACVAAKIMFSDNNRQCITKGDYNKHGPNAINQILE